MSFLTTYICVYNPNLGLLKTSKPLLFLLACSSTAYSSILVPLQVLNFRRHIHNHMVADDKGYTCWPGVVGVDSPPYTLTLTLFKTSQHLKWGFSTASTPINILQSPLPPLISDVNIYDKGVIVLLSYPSKNG